MLVGAGCAAEARHWSVKPSTACPKILFSATLQVPDFASLGHGQLAAQKHLILGSVVPAQS